MRLELRPTQVNLVLEALQAQYTWLLRRRDHYLGQRPKPEAILTHLEIRIEDHKDVYNYVLEQTMNESHFDHTIIGGPGPRTT